MSAASIPLVANGVRGGQPPHGRSHRRNHGLSITAQRPSSYSDSLAPSSPNSPYIPIDHTAEKEFPTANHTRRGSYLAFEVVNSPKDESFVEFANNVHHEHPPQHNYIAPTTLDQTASGYRIPLEHDGDANFHLTNILPQIASGILIPLPYVISYLLNPSSNIDKDRSDSNLKHHTDERSHRLEDTPFLHSCAYVSAALLVLGAYGKSRWAQESENGSSSVGKPRLASINREGFYEGFQRALSMWLPLYASFLLGFDAVAVVMLLRLSIGPEALSISSMRKKITQLLKQSKASFLFILLMMALDVGYLSSSSPLKLFTGYMALTLALVIKPYVYQRRGVASRKLFSPAINSKRAPGIIVDHDPTINIVAGASLGIFVIFISFISKLSITISSLSSVLVVGLCIALPSLYSHHSYVGKSQQITLASGAGLVVLATIIASEIQLAPIQLMRFGLASLSSWFDIKSQNNHDHLHNKVEKKPSKFTIWLLGVCEHWSFVHAILKERDSRRIFYFMSLNFAFMLVQLTYGIVTGSLGLLSDSIHMLFDCVALAAGLVAAVMSKWPPSSRFPYGYGKIDTLAGFGNGIFLMIISVEIIYEAIERLMSGSEVHRIGELFVVSTMGLLVNMVGIFAFDHAHHGHDHGHDHSHGHGNENMHGIFLHILADALGSVAVVSSTILVHFFGWSGFDPIASCLIAILIFVSAIPLVASTSKTLLLALPADVEYSLRDTLTGVSTLRGVVGYTVPKFWLDNTVHDHNHKHDHDHNHSHSHSHHNHNQHHHHHHGDSHGSDHSHHHGHVHSDSHTHSEHAHGSDRRLFGVIHVIGSRNADLSDVQRRTSNYLRQKGMDVLVQVEREGDGKCWCGGGNKAMS